MRRRYVILWSRVPETLALTASAAGLALALMGLI